MSTTVLDIMKCGNCGHDRFSLTQVRALDQAHVGGRGNGRVDGHIVIGCAKCGDESIIKALPSAFAIDGNCCSGWRS